MLFQTFIFMFKMLMFGTEHAVILSHKHPPDMFIISLISYVPTCWSVSLSTHGSPATGMILLGSRSQNGDQVVDVNAEGDGEERRAPKVAWGRSYVLQQLEGHRS